MLAGGRAVRLVRLAILIATFLLARLHEALSPHGYLWLLTGWSVMCAALISRNAGLLQEVERHFRA
jgi:hypothetical protein